MEGNNLSIGTNKCVLAYSGGLDTSAIIPWLIERGYEVHALLVDVGQQEDLDAACDKAIGLGAKTAITRDVQSEIVENVLPYVIGLATKYEGKYRLGTAISRPFIAAAQVERAREIGGATLVHGATGKGNDQVRFEHAYRSLAPDLPMLAPWKQWNLSGRRELANYLASRGFVQEELQIEKTYSLDENLWHLSIEGGPLEDPSSDLIISQILANMDGRFGASKGGMVQSPPNKVVFDFENGIPVALDGATMSLGEIVDQLNATFRHSPWAWDLVIENRFTGIKSRGVYVNPAAVLLQMAAEGLAQSTLNQPTYMQYMDLSNQYAGLLYRGEYFSDQRVIVEAGANAMLPYLTGSVGIRLSPVPYVSMVDAQESLFKQDLATFEKSNFSHADAQGFINLSWQSRLARPFSTQKKEHHVGPVASDRVLASSV